MTRLEQPVRQKSNITAAGVPISGKTKAALGVGFLLLALTLFWIGSMLHSTWNMASAEGTVVRFEDNGQLRSYRPVIRFMSASGEQREVTGSTSSSHPDYDIGQQVRIFYDEMDTHRRAIIDDFEQRWFPVLVACVLSLTWTVISGGVYLTERRAVFRATSPPVARTIHQRKRQLDRLAILVTVIPVVLGIGFLLGAGASLVHELHKTQRFSRAKGEVVDIKQNRTTYNQNAHIYSAVVVFKTNTGREITFAQDSSSSHIGYQDGEVVDVLYDRNTPERAMIDSFWDHWGLAIILFAIGFPFFAIGVFFALTVDFRRGR